MFFQHWGRVALLAHRVAALDQLGKLALAVDHHQVAVAAFHALDDLPGQGGLTRAGLAHNQDAEGLSTGH